MVIYSTARKLFWSAVCLTPISLIAFSTGPPVRRTGAPVDGGLTCVVCHQTFAPANSDPRGSVRVDAAPYTPGVTQTIRVTIAHPEQKRWGFQLTARLASNPAQEAGTFLTNSLVRVRCDSGHDAPCNGVLEFAEHNKAQFTDVGAGFTYTVDWTPPANAVGDVIFYAAGNAANGDGTLNGDRIYTTTALISPANCALPTMPVVAAAVSAASYQGPIAPNSLVALFGTGFQPLGLTRALYPADIVAKTVPTLLSCMAVEINRIRAPIFYTQYNQINVVVPSGVAPGPAEVRVVLNPNAGIATYSAPITVTAAAASPAIFTASPAAGKPGDMVTLYATGLGDTMPHVDAATIPTVAAPTANTVTVMLNGKPLLPSDVLYAGTAPGLMCGVYQVNIRIPAGTAAGDLPVKLAVNGASSPDGPTFHVNAP